jgi:hypothetical protein
MPVLYAGTLFRSHLEARWAIFLNHLDLKWEYEPQGFKTRGVPYLPDFAVFAPLGLLWAEIKPAWESDPEGVGKWRLFTTERPRPSRAALLTGKPAVRSVHLVIGGDEESDSPLRGPWEDDRQEWRPCPAGYHFDLAYPGTNRVRFAEDGCPDDFGRGGDARIENAVRVALSARFGKFAPDGTAA